MVELSFRQVLLNLQLIGILIVSGHRILQGSPDFSSDVSVKTVKRFSLTLLNFNTFFCFRFVRDENSCRIKSSY